VRPLLLVLLTVATVAALGVPAQAVTVNCVSPPTAIRSSNGINAGCLAATALSMSCTAQPRTGVAVISSTKS
jgi:hypothetical protein